MQTQPRPLLDTTVDADERQLRITRILLERAAADLEPIERNATGEQQDQLSSVLMTVLLALEELPVAK